MAEEKKASSSGKSFEDLMILLFLFILVGQAFQRAPEILQKHLGIELGKQELLMPSAAVTTGTSVGTQVNIPSGTAFFTSPEETNEQAGTFLPGSSVNIIDGPKLIDGEEWWLVEDANVGKRGWVRGTSLVLEGVGGIGPASKIGSKVKALIDTNLWENPGGLKKVGFISMGDMGVLTKGPKIENGSRWWFFDKDISGEEGWVPEAALLLASNVGWKEGSQVEGEYTTNIFERASGGNVLGFLQEGEGAQVLGGPVEKGGSFWWLVKTNKSIEGWIEESALKEVGVQGFFKGILAILMIFGSLLILGLLGGIVYITVRTNQIRAREKKKVLEAMSKNTLPRVNVRWNKIAEHVQSENPSDWRLAIIEADIILDELLTKIGYQGDSLGDKLKSVARGDLKNLDQAWEAHKVRNQIAHEGGDFILTQKEANRVIGMYTVVFQELKYL